ncbi:hypothetical protein RDI58_012994 [Solanum bulbocastanum]|uniref:Uncharacterized protein n=1 Tax=Solanum bulbocastanum TaxID=147425 RepID=A0AAN8TLA2_SOLBU
MGSTILQRASHSK